MSTFHKRKPLTSIAAGALMAASSAPGLAQTLPQPMENQVHIAPLAHNSSTLEIILFKPRFEQLTLYASMNLQAPRDFDSFALSVDQPDKGPAREIYCAVSREIGKNAGEFGQAVKTTRNQDKDGMLYTDPSIPFATNLSPNSQQSPLSDEGNKSMQLFAQSLESALRENDIPGSDIGPGVFLSFPGFLFDAVAKARSIPGGCNSGDATVQSISIRPQNDDFALSVRGRASATWQEFTVSRSSGSRYQINVVLTKRSSLDEEFADFAIDMRDLHDRHADPDAGIRCFTTFDPASRATKEPYSPREADVRQTPLDEEITRMMKRLAVAVSARAVQAKISIYDMDRGNNFLTLDPDARALLDKITSRPDGCTFPRSQDRVGLLRRGR